MIPIRKPKPPWVIVLAGGEGVRLRALTQAIHGDARAKQFAVLAGDRSLLQETVERAALLAPLDRVVVIVTSHQAALARQQLEPYPGVELVSQPRNLETGPGMLLPLARVLARDPSARVVFLPSDHHLVDARPIHAALDAIARGPTCDRVTLIGVPPDRREIAYGWIVRGAPLGRRDGVRSFEVKGFHEKPDAMTAARLRAGGALWNTFISSGPAAAFWAIARSHLPEHADALAIYAERIGRDDESDVLVATYAAMSPADFSRDVLARARGLATVAVTGTGWSDWGTPPRVLESLRGTPAFTQLVARLAVRSDRRDAAAEANAGS